MSIDFQSPVRSQHFVHPVKPNWISRLKLKTKISCGFTCAISIALLGALAGSAIGTFYIHQAKLKSEQGHEEGVLLSNLQIAILQVRSHQQQLIPLLESSELFRQEYAHFQLHLNQVTQLITQVKQQKTLSRIPGFNKFFQTYQNTPLAYQQKLASILNSVNIETLTPAERVTLERLLIQFSGSEIALEFDGISDDLTELKTVAFEEEEAAEADLDRALQLQIQIFLLSLIISSSIAILLAIYISRVISRPLQIVTAAAQEVTAESNFDYQIPVTSTDEVGTLATSFNQLIAQVKCLLETQRSEQESRLLESEKMSSLGRMLAGVAHEINNPVNFIYGNLTHANEYIRDLLSLLETYQQEIPNPPVAVREQAAEIDAEFLVEDLPKLLKSMEVGADRVRQIVLSLKDFSRLDESEPRSVDIHACLDSTLLILQNRLKKGIKVNCYYDKVPEVLGYTGLLYQVFMNILSNAIDALESDPKIDLEKQITIRTELLDMQWIQVKIIDNGPGIAPEHLSKIFETFFTTKPRGVGTGLGLAISRQIITEKHGGQLVCHSEVGKGTEFLIALPVKGDRTILSPVSKIPSLVRNGS